MTTLTISGNLAADPELRFTPNGKAVATFTVMTSKSVKKEDGTWENTDVTPWTVKCWNQLGENVAESLTKGTAVIVQGTAAMVSWEDKNGERRSKIEVTAYSVGVDLKRHIARVEKTARNSTPVDDAWTVKDSSFATSATEDIPF